MKGVLNIYKPHGWTSFDVVAKVRKELGVRKVGHAGTLDPIAEGVLIVLVGQATKNQDDYMHMPKQYNAEIALGIETDTYDLEGKVERIFEGDSILNSISLTDLKDIIQSFVGVAKQTVPPYSAVKIKGKRLYSLARTKNLEGIDLPIREVEIQEIKILGFEEKYIEKVARILPVLSLEIKCSKGTYIRSLSSDIGKKLGTGATLIKLIRQRVGNFDIRDSIKVEGIKNLKN